MRAATFGMLLTREPRHSACIWQASRDIWHLAGDPRHVACVRQASRDIWQAKRKSSAARNPRYTFSFGFPFFKMQFNVPIYWLTPTTRSENLLCESTETRSGSALAVSRPRGTEKGRQTGRRGKGFLSLNGRNNPGDELDC